VTVHHPQIEDWQDFRMLSGWIAIEVLEEGSETPWYGSVLVEAQTDIDFDERLVVLHDAEVTDHKFPGGEPSEAARELVGKAISRNPRSVLLDVLLRALPEDFEIPAQGKMTPELNFDPPRIVVSNTPLQLMFIDGEPVAAPIEDTDIEFLVNTNWDVFHDTKKDRWYVLNNGTWQYSNYLSSGEWKNTTRLPRDIKNLPETDNWKGVHAALPARKPKKTPVPILVSMEPTEMILIDGEPELATVPGLSLRYVTNTESDLFELQGQFYFVASGRWFTAPGLAEDWSAVKELPVDFAGIPADHEKGHVLASVPGTADARAAMIEASIPRRASISRNAGAELSVSYAGDPQWVAIEGTGLKRALNTPYQIIAYNAYFYLCHNAVWYFSLNAEGPWTVASNVPEEIYKIPATDPAHNVTYVFVEADDNDDEHVHYHYTSGYTGAFVFTWAVVWGTGWYYDPWTYWYPWGYPAYWRYPHSYGYGAWYNPATGRYGERAVGYGPYGGVASSAVYNPRTGAYARGASVWDNNEVARSGYGYNPRTDTYAAGNMYYDFDDREGWREGYVQRGDRWVYGESQLNDGTVRTRVETGAGGEAAIRRQDGNTTFAGRGSEGDLYAGRNGDVYKRGDDGWQKRENGGWSTMDDINRQSGVSRDVNRDAIQSRASQVDRSQFNTQQLNRQFNARQSGQRNFNNFQSQRSMPRRGGGRRR
jgi:hypothetical protein